MSSFARGNVRDEFVELGIGRRGRSVFADAEARATHMHVVGAPGKGKSAFLEHLLRQDVIAGRSVCVLDPHDQLVDNLLAWCASKRLLGRRRFVLLDPSAIDWSFGFNPLDLGAASAQEVARAVDGMIQACAQVWAGEDTARTPLLRRCLRAIFQVLAEQRLTLLEAVPLMSATDDGGLRRFLTRGIRHPLFREQWQDFNAMKARDFQEAFASTNNRLVEFLHAPAIERILGQRQHVLDFGPLMEEGAIVLVKLGSKTLSRESGQLLGALLLNDLLQKALRRTPGGRPLYLYVDECHRYLNDDMASVLTEGRKFGLHAVLAHQNLGQLREAGEGVYRAVMGGAQTKVLFGLSDPEDAELLARTLFAGEFDYEEPKHRFDRPTVVGLERVRLSNWQESEGSSEMQGTTSTESVGWTEGESWSDDDPLAQVVSESLREQTSLGETAAQTRSRTRSSGESEALVPVLAQLPSQGFSLDELRDRAAAEVMNLPRKRAIVKILTARSERIRVPEVAPALIRRERIERFREELLARSGYARPIAEVEAELSERRQLLAAEAHRYAHPPEPERFRE